MAASPGFGEEGDGVLGTPSLQGQLKQTQPFHRAQEPAGIPHNFIQLL